MKLYIIPIERACNASCNFCITKSRYFCEKEILKLNNLEKTIKEFDLDKIEITGGGEPTLHPAINKIIEICSEKTATIMYTNAMDLRRCYNLDKLSSLCISLAHHKKIQNEKIMGSYPDFSLIKRLKAPVKLSLLLLKSGINTTDRVLSYLDFAQKFANKVVIRQLFDETNNELLKIEFISSEAVFKDLHLENYSLNKQGNPVFYHHRLEVEVEYRICSCENNNLVLHSDGNLYKGWTKERHDTYRK